MFAASGFVQNELSRPTNNERLLAAALHLEHCMKDRVEHEKHPFDYLDLSEKPQALEDLEAPNKVYKYLSMRFNHEHVNDFRKRHLSISNDSLKYFHKYLKILKQPFTKHWSFMPFETFIYVFNLMFQKKINDGALWRDFLYLAHENLGTLKNCINFMDPHVFEFMLQNLKVIKNESDTYHHIQEMLPINTCLLPSHFQHLSILLRFGHERNFNEKYLLSSIVIDWHSHFERSFYRDQELFTRKYPLKRIHYFLQMYAVFNTEEPAQRANLLNVVKQLFRAIPDPFITSREIEDISEMFDPPLTSGNLECFALQFEQEFGVNVSSPRSLRHLSRCAVRSAINENGKLPEGIEELRLPQFMKDYLNLIR